MLATHMTLGVCRSLDHCKATALSTERLQNNLLVESRLGRAMLVGEHLCVRTELLGGCNARLVVTQKPPRQGGIRPSREDRPQAASCRDGTRDHSLGCLRSTPQPMHS